MRSQMDKINFKAHTRTFLVVILTIILSSACVPKPPPEIVNKKVIVSYYGEVTNEVAYIGDKITYRIYYTNSTKDVATIVIRDQLEKALRNVEVHNDGIYDPSGHTVQWTIKDVPTFTTGYVEFEAQIGQTKRITNEALIQVTTKHDGTIKRIKTNIVESKICSQPKLGWIPFTLQAEKDSKPFYALKDETTMGILVNFEFSGMWVREKIIDKTTYHELSIPTLSSVNDEGKPALPIAGKIIEIPRDVDFELEIYKSDSVQFSCYNAIPFQELTTEQAGDSLKKFEIDSKIYTKNTDYPGKLASIDIQDMGIVRGHRLVFLKVHPVQFNPVQKSLTAFSHIEVRIKYDKPAQIEPIESRLYSSAFEEILEASVYNYKFDRLVEEDEGEGTEDDNDDKRTGCDYLIITEDAFYDDSDLNNPVNQLVQWKTRKGLVVDVVKISAIGNTAADIRTYMERAYEKWTRVPAYVVLIGDANHITPDYRTGHASHTVPIGGAQVATEVGTDLYYSTLDGADYFPDLMLSRISVDDIAELRAVVDKSILYEKNPPALDDYYNTTSLVRLFEDDTDPQPVGAPPDGCPSDDMEDCGWVLIERAEEMRDYLMGEGYIADRIYNFSGGIAGGPQRWENGNNLPNDLTQQNPDPFAWNGDQNDIEDAFDAGNFLITYRGHGNREGWGRPRFRIADIQNLDDNDMPAFVFGLTCQSGWFDDETDDAGLGTNTDCFAEEMLRADGGGALGIVASARNSWGSCNNPTTEGMCDALWPDFDNNIHGSFLPRMGQLFVYSKTYLAQNVGAINSRLITFEMTHLFGEPELPIWIAEPGNMKVSHPGGVGTTGKQDIVVKVTDDASGDPVNNAVVVLTRGLTILAGVQTDAGGNARITLNNVGADTIDVTVTSKFFRPYMGSMDAITSGAYINVLDPENGVENQTIYLGGKSFQGNEEVKIYFDGSLVETTNAAAGEFGQSNDFTFEVPIGKALGLYNVVARGSTSGSYAVDVFQVRDDRIVDLYTYSQWDESTWSLEPNVKKVWNSPEIWLKDGGTEVASNNLVVGTNYKLNARVYNDSNNNASSVQVTFKWAQHGIGQIVWDDIITVPIDVLANGSEVAEVDWTPHATGHVCVKAEIYHVEDIKSSNNMGQENCHVGVAASPAKLEFALCNPTKEPAMVFLEVYQLPTKDQEGRPMHLWGSFIEHPDPQLLKPEECREAVVVVDPDDSIGKPIKGDVAKFTVSGYINRKLIGGVDFEVVKQ